MSNKTLIGQLWPGAMVDVVEDVIRLGGSWHNIVIEGVVKAWDDALVYRVARALREHWNPILLDIGANSGSFALIPAIYPRVRVFAVEPHPKANDTLNANVALNNILGKTAIYRVAISNETKHKVLRCPVHVQSGLSILGGQPKRFEEQHQYIVNAYTLDDFMATFNVPHPAVIKMDIEGHEVKALEGADKTLRRRNGDRPFLLLEADERNLAQHNARMDDLTGRLNELDYDFEFINKDNVWCTPKENKHD